MNRSPPLGSASRARVDSCRASASGPSCSTDLKLIASKPSGSGSRLASAATKPMRGAVARSSDVAPGPVQSLRQIEHRGLEQGIDRAKGKNEGAGIAADVQQPPCATQRHERRQQRRLVLGQRGGVIEPAPHEGQVFGESVPARSSANSSNTAPEPIYAPLSNSIAGRWSRTSRAARSRKASLLSRAARRSAAVKRDVSATVPWAQRRAPGAFEQPGEQLQAARVELRATSKERVCCGPCPSLSTRPDLSASPRAALPMKLSRKASSGAAVIGQRQVESDCAALARRQRAIRVEQVEADTKSATGGIEDAIDHCDGGWVHAGHRLVERRWATVPGHTFRHRETGKRFNAQGIECDKGDDGGVLGQQYSPALRPRAAM